MKNGKYFEPGWVRVYITLATFVIFGLFWVFKLDAHTTDEKVAHMTVESRDEVKSMKSEIGYQKLEIQRVDKAWKESMKEIKKDMNRGFDRIENLIRNGR